jgi:hypothetical protein
MLTWTEYFAKNKKASLPAFGVVVLIWFLARHHFFAASYGLLFIAAIAFTWYLFKPKQQFRQ